MIKTSQANTKCIHYKKVNLSACFNADKLTAEIFVHKAHHWALYNVWFQNMFDCEYKTCTQTDAYEQHSK